MSRPTYESVLKSKAFYFPEILCTFCMHALTRKTHIDAHAGFFPARGKSTKFPSRSPKNGIAVPNFQPILTQGATLRSLGCVMTKIYIT